MCATTQNYGFENKGRTPMLHDVVRACELALRDIAPAI